MIILFLVLVVCVSIGIFLLGMLGFDVASGEFGLDIAGAYWFSAFLIVFFSTMIYVFAAGA